MMDYLRFMTSRFGIYQPLVPTLSEALQQTKQLHLLELGAGAGGGTDGVARALRQLPGLADLHVTLTDLYPQPEAWQAIQKSAGGQISYVTAPVDATAVPAELSGFRTIFSAFHHFRPAVAEAILADAVRQGAGIGVFEGAGKHWYEILLAWTLLPLVQILATPFMQPFRLSRLFFTFVVPLIPLCTILDGTVSILRMYPTAQLLKLAHRADLGGKFEWRAGKVKHWSGSEVTYLVGWPRET